MTVSMPMTRRLAKCLVPGYSALYWCNEGSGTTLTDYSGNGRDGTLGAAGAAPTWTAEGLSFDGGDYVALPDLPTTGTIAFVFYTAAPITAASGATTIFGCTSGGVAYPGVKFGATVGGLTNEIITVITDGSCRAAWCDAVASIATGWHVLTCAYTGSTWAITLDGEAKPVTLAGTASAFVTPTVAKLGTASAATGEFISAKVAAVLMYPTGLTTAQTAQNAGALAAVAAARGITFA